jgi:transposase
MIWHQSPLGIRRMSPSRASWLCMCQPATLDEQQRSLVERLRTAHPDLETAYHLSQACVSMLAEHRAQDLDDWLLQAKQSGVRELKGFAEAHSPGLCCSESGLCFKVE